jgi:hypothetical protein
LIAAIFGEEILFKDFLFEVDDPVFRDTGFGVEEAFYPTIFTQGSLPKEESATSITRKISDGTGWLFA